MAIQTARLLHLWCVLILDEQWNGRKCHNSKCIASTHRLYDTTKSCFTYHLIHFIAPHHMCFHKIKCMYRKEILLHLWWVDTFMVCCYIYKNPWRPCMLQLTINVAKSIDIFRFTTDIYWHQLDINQNRYLHAHHISNWCWRRISEI